MLRLPTVAHRDCTEFGPVAIKGGLMADGQIIATIDTFDREALVPLGMLPPGTHSVEVANMEVSCKSFFGIAVPVRLADNHCTVEFTVATHRTYTLVVNASEDDNAVCVIR